MSRSLARRAFWLALAAWLGAGALAVAVAAQSIPAAFVVAVAGGVLCGALSAHRLDGRRVHHRRPRAAPAAPAADVARGFPPPGPGD